MVAPPRALGVLRQAYSHNLRAALRAEIDKDFVKLPVHEIEKHLAAQQSARMVSSNAIRSSGASLIAASYAAYAARRLLHELSHVARTGSPRRPCRARASSLTKSRTGSGARGSPADSRWRTRCARPGSRSARLHRADGAAEAGGVEHHVVAADSGRSPCSPSCRGGHCPACPRNPCPGSERMRPSSAARPPPRCDMWTVRLGWRSNTPELISRIVAITSENSRPTERAVS